MPKGEHRRDDYGRFMCPRCGINRIARRKGTLCGDCTYVLRLTPELMPEWVDTPRPETVGSEP